jgi:hypothetical protein
LIIADSKLSFTAIIVYCNYRLLQLSFTTISLVHDFADLLPTIADLSQVTGHLLQICTDRQHRSILN